METALSTTLASTESRLGSRRTLSLAAAVALVALAGCGPQTPPSAAPTATPGAAAAAIPVNTAPAVEATHDIVSPAPNDGVPPQVTNAPAIQAEPARPAGTPVPPRPAVVSAPAPAPAVVAQAPRAHARPAPRAVPVVLRGEVRSIEPIQERPPGTGAGAVIGGVLGGVVGNQFGHGGGRTAMTVLGAAGGAVAGHNVERNINKRIVGYKVSVRLDNGEVRTFQESRLDGLHVGDRVRVEGKHLRRA